MPGGGLYALVAYGAQNVLLSGNPDFTYFYKTYKKYAHFAEESVTYSMDGPQDLSYNQPVQVRFKIQRIADLVRDMYFLFDLPDIYCKYIENLPLSNGRTSQYNFAWVQYVGCHIIQNIGFFIGGQKIQEFDGSYMIARAQSDLDTRSFQKWSRLVGNIPDIYDPANGLYGGGSTGTGYPLVYNNNGEGASTTTPPNINRPSIAGRTLQVPLPFWFTESTFESLPLVSLQYQECEVQITLRPINQLYRVLDSNGNQVAPGYQYNPSPVSLLPENVYYSSVSDISDVTITNFLTDIGTPNPLLNTWPLNPRIQLTYVYITDEERKQFASEPLQYLVRQITTYEFPGLTTRELLELNTHNPVERMIIVPRRSDSLQYRNQVANFSNWINPLKPPFLPTQGGWPPNVNLTSATGNFVLYGQRSIVVAMAVLGDGNLLQEEKPLEYFTQVVPWKYLTGIPDPELIVYPFGLHSPTTQPDGSVNSSRIKLFQVDLQVYPLPGNSFYQYDVTIYVESLNWVNIASGMGGLKYAL
uniref:Major capsid protein N-terminal domain-containing protein n=1 Tax=viral metagenome TaxID=1070528 RepID=A0A6C0KL14_9ZZZZ